MDLAEESGVTEINSKLLCKGLRRADPAMPGRIFHFEFVDFRMLLLC